MKKPSWTLTDVEKVAQENKYTFYRAPQEAIAALKVGDDVKLSFAPVEPSENFGAERMWVEIEMIDGSGGFIGRLQNQPVHIKDLTINDQVRFSECHIMNTGNEDQFQDTGLVAKYRVRCFVSNKILRDKEKVAVLFREAPEVPGDSGWRFFAGTETKAYLAREDSMQFVSLGAVLRCGDAFVDLLDSPVGAYFELDMETNQYVVVAPDDEDDEGLGRSSTSVH